MQSTEPPQSAQTEQSPHPTERYVTVKDAAQVFGISAVVVYRLFRAGRLPGRKFGRSYRVLREFVDGFDAEVRAGRGVDFDEYADAWFARVSEGAA
ncbi:helix-turn-helix domain-containing protein [Thermomonospora umbrina]|uniref:Excisionase family DNA binding protein n=1 Tax=Thermomonospora umbrina TaxID=111806 RepID=A0A3D9T536_9ACTN|nr:helix-turn-helix domain-containing protein [Thermomonospora umbrina]REF00356.1 excisionase family DNA binding protein [Thermomonospora umbrina]